MPHTLRVLMFVGDDYEDLEVWYPALRLREAGVRVTLGSDDPPYFGASIGGEYDVCSREFGFGEETLRAITRTAIEAAFCDQTLKDRLTEKL